jgi:crotonobetainyl-CoA:carnitine CoA-transferase CaiB-like acyl-CoA transferase
VLETAMLLPGPWAGLILAELGADVIKVEPPGGDPARRFPPFRGQVGGLFLQLNRGKRGIVLDLKADQDRDTFLRLVQTADVVIDSWRPGVAGRLGVDHAALAALNPRIVTCSITGYGETGPRRTLPGHDVNYTAWAGILALTGSPAGGPAIPAVQFADLGGGAFPAVIAVLAALRERERIGRGRHIDAAMALGAVPLNQVAFGIVDAGIDAPAPGDGPLTGGFPSFRVYPTRRGHLAVGTIEDKFWRVFCETIGLPEFYDDAHAMGERRDEVVRRIEARLAEATAEEWEERFRGQETCVERLRSPGEVLADPWLRQSGVVYTEKHPACGPLTQVRALPAWRDGAKLEPAPLLGEHTQEILRQLEP